MKVCLVCGYKQNPDGSFREQLMLRCERAIGLQKAGVVNQLYIVVGVTRNDVSMGGEMKLCLESRGVPPNGIIFSPVAWNTVEEVDTFLKLVGEYCGRNEKPKFYVVSTWYHLPRIFWLFLARRRFVRLISARRGGVTAGDLFQEVIKFAHNLFDPFQRIDPLAIIRRRRERQSREREESRRLKVVT